MNRSTRRVVWILNAIIAILAVLSVAGYFLFPFWQFKLDYTLTSDNIKEMVEQIGDSSDFELDPDQLLGDEDVTISISLTVESTVLVSSLTGSGEDTIAAFVDSNVERIIANLTDTFFGLAKGMMKSVTASVVHQQVMQNAKDILKEANPEITDEEIEEKLASAGVDQEYIDEKMNGIIDKIYEGEATTESVTDDIVESVKEVYSKMAEADDEDFQDMELSEEAEAELRETIGDIVKELADENGNIDPDELLAALMLQAVQGMNSESATSSANGATLLAASDESDGSDGSSETEGAGGTASGSATERLREEVQTLVRGYIPPEAEEIIVYVFWGLLGLMIFSCLQWVYILVKMLVKLIRRAKNPTVKLKAPIWLGWLPFLLLVGVPTIALTVLQSTDIMTDLLADMIPAEATGMLENLKMSFSSGGWIAAVAALVCLGISIYYIVARKKYKRRLKAGYTDPEEQDDFETDEADDYEEDDE